MTKEEIQKNSEHWYNKYKDAEKRIEELENQNKELKNNNKVYCEGNGETLVVNVSFDSFTRINANHKLYYPHNKELENQNKLLGERCNQLLRDKGNLTDQIADIKANCDLAIEGRDVKIAELEQALEGYKENATWCDKCKRIIKAKEHIRTLISCLKDWVQEGNKDYCHISGAEQFLREIQENVL